MQLEKIIDGKKVIIDITEDEIKDLNLQKRKQAKASKLIFKLSMPKNNAYNNKWTNDDKLFIIAKDIKNVKDYKKIIEKSPYLYDFQDGWVAQIDVSLVNNYEYGLMKKQSSGFCGYDWMVKSIIDDKVIKTK